MMRAIKLLAILAICFIPVLALAAPYVTESIPAGQKYEVPVYFSEKNIPVSYESLAIICSSPCSSLQESLEALAKEAKKQGRMGY
jgi:hypothetical protein